MNIVTFFFKILCFFAKQSEKRSTMTATSLDFLKKLIDTPSPSGFETPGQKVWLDYVKSFADETFSDSYGNAVAILNPKGSPKIMVSGHADEIGLMVNYIDAEGFIYFQRIGGVDHTLLRAKRVNIHTEKGLVRGVIGATAIHLIDPKDRDKSPKLHELYIDIGARTKKEAERVVQVGDPITFEEGFEVLRGDLAVAKAFDNKIGTFSAAEVLRLVHKKRKNLKACVYAVSTVQEELGGFGARMIANQLKPDAAIAIDVTHATDSPSISKQKAGEVKLSKGPVITFGSANHPVIAKRLLETAKAAKIAIQKEANSNRTGTDADSIFSQASGIPTVTIGLPNRYMHTSVEMISLVDLEKLSELLAAFCLSAKKEERFRVKI